MTGKTCRHLSGNVGQDGLKYLQGDGVAHASTCHVLADRLQAHAQSDNCQRVCGLARNVQDRPRTVNNRNLKFPPIPEEADVGPPAFHGRPTPPCHELHVLFIVVVEVLSAMHPPSNDVAFDPDPLLPSSQGTITEPLPATRLPHSPRPPSVPPRNPLRLSVTSVRNEDSDCPTSPTISSLRMRIVHTQSLPLLATVKTITVNTNETINVDGKPLEKSLPESPIMVPLSPVDIDDGDSSTGSSSILNNAVPSPPSMSKRNHALLELLSSERAYASDLALIRDIHIPLALGE